jgi:hypothetical protein
MKNRRLLTLVICSKYRSRGLQLLMALAILR